MYFLISMWVLNLCFALSDSQNIAFDCTSDQSNYTTLSLLEVGDCRFEETDFNETDTEIQLLQLKESTYVDIYSCLITLQYQVYHCGMHSHISLVKGGIVAENYQMSSEECKIMHSLRRVRVYGQEYQITKFNETTKRWITLAGGIDNDGTCSGGTLNNRWGNYVNVVAHGQLTIMLSTGIAIKMLKEDTIRLSSGIICKIDSLDCLDPTFGYTFWDLKSFFPCAPDAYHVVYQGVATKISTIMGKNRESPINNYMFSVKTTDQIFTLATIGNKNVCNLQVYQTEHPKYLIVEIKQGNSYFVQKQIPVQDLDLFIYVNAKVLHISRGIEKSIRHIYKTLSIEICELERSHLKTLQTLAYISPISFAFQYMNSPGYTAISSGEVIHLIKCHPVPIFPRADQDCTVEHPVYYKNESYYVTPRSHILQKTGTPSPCSNILAPEYYINGKWYISNKGMTPTKDPIILSPKRPHTWEGLDLGNIMHAGIYTSEQIERVRHQIMYPQERKAIAETFAGTINGDSISHTNLDYGLIINSDHLKNRFHEWWLGTWGWFKWIGNCGSIIFTLYFLYLGLKLVCNAVFRLKALHELFGCSLILITSIVDGLADYILHKNAHKFSERNNVASADKDYFLN